MSKPAAEFITYRNEDKIFYRKLIGLLWLYLDCFKSDKKPFLKSYISHDLVAG